MRLRTSPGIVIAVLLSISSGICWPKQNLIAPTYYLAINSSGCQFDEITVKGASNLPPESVIELRVADFVGDFGWRYYSPEVNVSIKRQGYFEATIHPASGMTFKPNLVVTAAFSPATYHQPKNVLAIVGRRGQNLGFPQNPQAGKLSGDYSYLFAIARVGACLSAEEQSRPLPNPKSPTTRMRLP